MAHSTATAPVYPGAGSSARRDQREVASGSPLTARRQAPSPGARETSKQENGRDNPSPSALTNASLRVQQSKNPRLRFEPSSDSSALLSRSEKKRFAIPS